MEMITDDDMQTGKSSIQNANDYRGKHENYSIISPEC